MSNNYYIYIYIYSNIQGILGSTNEELEEFGNLLYKFSKKQMIIFHLMKQKKESDFLDFKNHLSERCEQRDVPLKTLITMSAIFNPHLSSPSFLFPEVHNIQIFLDFSS